MSDAPGSRQGVMLGQMILGIAGVFLGVLLGLLMVRGLLLSNIKPDAWNISGVFVFCLLAAFLIWIGVRAVRRGKGQFVPKATIRWGWMLAGIWLIFFSLHSHFYPGPNSYKPADAGEAIGMLILTIFMAVVGGVLIIVSILPLLRKASW